MLNLWKAAILSMAYRWSFTIVTGTLSKLCLRTVIRYLVKIEVGYIEQGKPSSPADFGLGPE